MYDVVMYTINLMHVIYVMYVASVMYYHVVKHWGQELEDNQQAVHKITNSGPTMGEQSIHIKILNKYQKSDD